MSSQSPDRRRSIAQSSLRAAAEAIQRFLDVEVVCDEAVEPVSDSIEPESILAAPDDVLCCASMLVSMTSRQGADVDAESIAAGRLMLAWRPGDAAGLVELALATSISAPEPAAWSELERSALAETANVVGCAFLNAVATEVDSACTLGLSLVPSPPHLSEEFAGSLMQAAVAEMECLSSSVVNERIWLASSHFRVVGRSIGTRLVMVWQPDVWDLMNRSGQDESPC